MGSQLLLFFSALGLRLLFLSSQLRVNPIFSHLMMDERMHDLWARQLASGQGLGGAPFFRAPGYYGLLALVYRICGHEVLAGRILGCVLGSFSVVIIFKLGKRLSGRHVGLIAGWIAVVYWPLIYFDIQLLSPALEIFLNLLVFLLLFKAREKSSHWLFLGAGMVLGLSAITRPTILSFAPFLAIWILLPDSEGRNWKVGLRQAATLTLGTILCVMPVSLYNWAHQGHFVLIATNGGVNFFIGNNPESNGMTAVVPGTRKGWESGFEDTHKIAEHAVGHQLPEALVSSYWYHRAFEWIASNPKAWLRLMIHKFRLYWSPHEIGNNQAIRPIANMSLMMRLLGWVGFPLLCVLALPGLVVARGRQWGLLLIFVLTSMLTTILFFCNARYRLPVVPILILLAGAGIVHLASLLVKGRWKELVPATCVSALVALFVFTNPPSSRKFNRDSEANHDLQLAQAYSSAGDHETRDLEKAEQFYRRVLALWPGFPEASLGLADILRTEGHYKQAREVLETALKINPDHAGLVWALANTKAAAGETVRAIEDFKRLIKLTPEDAKVREGLGCLQWAIGRSEEARKNLSRALEIDPGLTRARQCLDGLRRMSPQSSK